MKKQARHPYVVFLDLNLPPGSPLRMTREWFEDVVDPVLPARSREGNSDPWDLLVLSNYADHYVEQECPAPPGYVVAIMGRNRTVVPEHVRIFRAIFDAANEFGSIPDRFETDG